jgi:CRP/FNR family transcriptional regulator
MSHASFPHLFCGETVEARELHRMATRVSLPAEKIIFLEGEPADNAFGLSEGVVRLFKLMLDGRRQIVALALPGDFLELPSVDRHRYTATAIGQVVFARFPRKQLMSFIRANPRLKNLLVEFATRQLNSAQDQLLILGKGSAEEKISFFLLSWRNRLAALRPFSDVLPLPMWREDIADLLGLTLETVSRTLSRLEKKNLIRIVPKGVLLTGLEPDVLPNALTD